ncbi:MAG: integrin alpha, partial [Ignavibacteria bacterium]|nr:integrin alpha [Ignavibacteria bacterium]
MFIVLLTCTVSIAQIKEQIDLNSKARELGITKSALNGILNSALSNGGNGDPLPDALTERFFTGQAPLDFFGSSVSNAGDVNGDGYSDVIIGASRSDAGGTDAGRAYIYYGGVSMDYIADVILTGAAANDNFGNSVSSAGDVNGDGYSDVIVGAYNNDAIASNAGAAYIYFGGSSMNNTADITLTGVAADDNFGYSAATAGDVNGDGYSDVVVGARYNDIGGIDAGRAYIYYGGSSMNALVDKILTGLTAGDYFGISVATAGDVNGDGYSDVIVGAYNNDAGGSNAGRAYIYYGGPSDNLADVILTGAASGDSFGWSVSTAGDVNGDGYSDVIVGAFNNDAGGSNAGRAYIYFGGASMDNTADAILTGKTASDFFGYSVSAAGDVNGDGYGDVIVGAISNDAGGSAAGRAYVYFGGAPMDNISDALFTGDAAGDSFGQSVSAAGDVNGDGYSDLIVGAGSNDAAGQNAGRAYLYLNSLTGPDIPDEFFTGAATGDNFGVSVSIAGDVNGDGYDDLIVGAPYNSSVGTYAGQAYIYFGGVLSDNIEDVIITGASAQDNLGVSVSNAGDVNGDGYSDVIVGASGYNSGTGRAYIYYGGSSMNNSADVILTGAALYDHFGHSVSTAGDVNGDGYADVIVGALDNDAGGTNAGTAYVYYGGAAMNNAADVIITGYQAEDGLGISVSTAGDVNGDGYSDVIVGAYENDAGGSNAGAAYIYYGSVSMDYWSDVTLTGAAAENYFGSSVSEAGDVNGDGYGDVIVGAYGNEGGGYITGRAYIYFGGSSMNSTADKILTGEGYDRFGYSVSQAGDVNGDGYSDVIIGATGMGTDEGNAYIYYGGVSMDIMADVIMTGESRTSYFGYSVSGAGDVNGDGLCDVFVGARSDERAYLYLSSAPPIKPRIMSVKDVPYDQGGQVFLNFVRSGYDARGESNVITEYIVERSNPPGVNGFSWSQIGSVQPLQNPFYTLVASTPNDSVTNNSGTYYFRVTARTNNANEYWRSNILYGHSTDNLAPAAPLAFYAALNSGDVKLGWQANTEPDFLDYYIYRSDTPLAEDLTLLGTTSDTVYTDTTPLSGNAYYYLSALDIHNNGSPFSTDSVEAILSADIKVYLEGSYIGGQMSTFLNSSGNIPLSQPYNTSPWNY